MGAVCAPPGSRRSRALKLTPQEQRLEEAGARRPNLLPRTPIRDRAPKREGALCRPAAVATVGPVAAGSRRASAAAAWRGARGGSASIHRGARAAAAPGARGVSARIHRGARAAAAAAPNQRAPAKAAESDDQDSLTLLYTNPGGCVKSKLLQGAPLREWVDKKKPDFLLLAETKICDQKDLPDIPGYFTLGKMADRNKKGSGGCAIYTVKNLKYVVQQARVSKNHNIIWIKAATNPKPLYICCAYCRTQNYADIVHNFFDELLSDTLYFKSLGEVVLVGDFNAHLGELSGDKQPNGTWRTNNNKPLLLDLAKISGLSILNCEQARGVPTMIKECNGHSIIDYALADPSANLRVEELQMDHFHAHNSVLVVDVPFSALRSLDFRPCLRINREKYMRVLDGLFSHSDVNSMEDFLRLFKTARECSTEKCAPRPDGANLNVPALKKLRAMRKRVSAQIARARSDETLSRLQRKLKKIRKKLVVVEKAIIRDHWAKFAERLEKLGGRRRDLEFWNAVRKLQGRERHRSAGRVVKLGNKLSKSPDEFLEGFAQFYSKLYTPRKKPSALRLDCEERNKLRAKLNIAGPFGDSPSREEFDFAISQQRSSSGPGIHKTSARDLKDCSENVKSKLFELITDFFENETDLNCLKKTIYVPLLKDLEEDSTDPANYRPIALLPQIFKLIESIISSRLSNFLENTQKLNEEMAGFRPKRSTADNLLIIRELILDNRHKKKSKPLFFAFLDIKKCFDKVSRPIVFDRLWRLGVTGKLWRLIRSLFSGISGQVRIDGIFSRTFEVESGIVQGSRLGPILFNVFFNDFITQLKAHPGAALRTGTVLSSLAYADDLVVVAHSRQDLQNLLDFCYTYSLENEFTFAPTKCKVMLVDVPGKAATCVPFTLGPSPLEIVKSFKYLGIHLSRSVEPGNKPRPFSKFADSVAKRAQSKIAALVSITKKCRHL